MVDNDIDIPVAPFVPSIPPVMNPQASAPLEGDDGDGRRRSSRVMLPTGGQEHVGVDSHTIELLQGQGYTKGLAEALSRNKLEFPLSIWVVDNSGSMQHRDASRILESSTQKQVKFVQCTRWAEMKQTVEYHAQMSAVLQSPTVFRMLNDPGRTAGPQQFSIAERGSEFIDEDLALARQTMENSSPGGVTPLIPHLREIHENVLAMENELRANGSKVVLVLATDGLPTNERGIFDATVQREFGEALRAFEGLPVWVVVRLCTDDEEVVSFWNSIDEQLERSLEVLDDFIAEAQEVHKHNPWINYGLPLHRMREMGFHHRLFDLMDERQLAKDELLAFFRLLFGRDSLQGAPDPEEDWKAFYNRIGEIATKEEGKTWNPISKRMEPWVDLRSLKTIYGGGSRGSGWFSMSFTG